MEKEISDILLRKKYSLLTEIIKSHAPGAVAFSGGVDSAFLLWTACQTLGSGTAAITARSAFVTDREMAEAEDFCRSRGISQVVCDIDVLENSDIAENPPDRCYHCKHEIFSAMLRAAEEKGFTCIMDGTNADDSRDYRPGLRALKELGIVSPLQEAGLGKSEIRKLSEIFGLPTWNRPSAACLASRFAYGEKIMGDRLRMVEKAENYLRGLGFGQLRVRVHGSLARLELLPEDMARLAEEDLSEKISLRLKELGFSYVTVDLQGYRTGSMNEVLYLDSEHENAGSETGAEQYPSGGE